MTEPYKIVISIKAELVPLRNDGSLSGIPVFKDKKLVASDMVDKEIGIEKIKEVIKNFKI